MTKRFLRSPVSIIVTNRCRVRIDESDQYLRYDPAADGAQALTFRTRIRFAKNVVPEGCLALPTCRGDANLLRSEGNDSHVTRHGFARWQPDTLATLQVTNGEGVIIVNLSLTRDGHWQRNECPHQLAVDFL